MSNGNAGRGASSQIENKVDTIIANILPKTVFEVKEDWDLNGSICILPQDIVIKQAGGVIKNGTLIGYNTKIVGKDPLFDKVHIGGSWLVREISTSLFKDLDYDNSLRDVLALSNSHIHNRIDIEAGFYFFDLNSNNPNGIVVTDSTTLNVEGVLLLKPNSLSHYSIISVNGDNITIKGNGVIKGDKREHLGKEGEWGMGIKIGASNNIEIRDVNICKCWGDCIYIGQNSHNIVVKGCSLNEGRRQGISITSGSDIEIHNCTITNIGGTNPQYAIDIEPNKNCRVDNVVIRNTIAMNCIGGFMSTCNNKVASIGSITVVGCTIGDISKFPLKFKNSEKVKIDSCNVSSDANYGLLAINVKDISGQYNKYKSPKNKNILLMSCKNTGLDGKIQYK